MAVKSSGSLSMKTDIVGEFGGTAPHGLKEYYRDGSAGVTPNNTDIPTTGEIGFKDFYGAIKQFEHTITSNQQELDLNTYLTGQGWNGSDAVALTIDTNVYIWSDSTSVAGLTISSAFSGILDITNKGYIIGKGGQGGYRADNATDGGPAISNAATGVTLTNNSGAFIAGGGGGGAGSTDDSGGDDQGHGGGGAGGGAGGGQLSGRLGGAGGAVGQVGANGGNEYVGGTPAYGGGAGGGGGGADGSNGGGGGGGGRILGSGATGGAGGVDIHAGGAGGSNGNVGGSVTYGGGGGGGGWGAAGGNANNYYGATTGGAGGAAIAGTSISVTDNGTIYGSQA